MTDEKPRKPRAGKPGGDRPIRRTSASGGGRLQGKPREFKPREGGKFSRPDGERKPRFDKAEKPAPRARPAKPAREAKKFTPPERTTAFEGERIAKVMARAGVCSRRDAEEWIAAGRVAVNGVVLKTPAVNVKEDDRIEIDGAPMQARERTRLFLFHKPAGLVTTARDEEGRPTVFSYLEEHFPDLPRVVSVGRLDINTEGLLLLTNDGGLARTLELPATGWTRRYRVRAHGETDQAQLDALREGVSIEGVDYAPIDARLERVQGSNAWIAMSLTEGKNREVKRVMGHLGLDVTRLIRVSYGPFQLGELKEGTVEEVRLKTLREQLGKSLAELAGVDFGAPLRDATPEEEQEKRQRADARPRKHVSVMRGERAQKREEGPRARVTTSATADRKGRAVAVERVTVVRKRPSEDEARSSRNAQRFAAMRDGGPRRGRDVHDEGGREERRPARSATGEAPQRRLARPGADEPRRVAPPRGREERAPRERGTARHGASEGRRSGGFEERSFESRGRAPSRERQERGGFEKPPRERKYEKRDGVRNFERPRDHADTRRPMRSRDGESNPRAPRRDVGDQPRGDSASRKGPPRKGPPKGGAPRSGGPRKGPPRKGPPRKPRGE